MTLDDIFIEDNVFIIRKSDLPFDSSFNTARKLKVGAITAIRIPNLSCNLLGGRYKSKNIEFSTKGNGANYWSGDKIKLTDFDGDYSKNSNDPIFIQAKLLHNKQVPFEGPITKDNKEKTKGLPFEPVGSNGMRLYGIAKITHSPTNLNYWHIEIVVHDFKDNPIKNNNSKFNEHACDFILDIISEGAQMVDPPNLFKINKNYYLAN